MHKDELQPSYQVEKQIYCGSPYHQMMGLLDAPGKVSFGNIGADGENLSIGILSMNRSELTKRLMDSIAEHIPGFKGVFLILDNGSTKEELDRVRKYAAEAPFKCQIEALDRNYGVSGGRNRMMKAAKTDWVLSIDNDMVFTSNPLPNAQKDIATLGVHFLVMPFVNSMNVNSGLFGGNVYIEPINGRVNIGIGTAIKCENLRMNEPAPGFLCTGIAGGTSIFNRHTFLKLGGFDENMFVGFEDTEFSLRVFQEGYKVGSCGMISLSHNHVVTQAASDADYERVRFHKELLYQSAVHFEKKHGFGVWNKSVEEWVVRRRNELNLEANLENGKERVRIRPKVGLVIDRADWAFDHIAEQVIRYLSDRYEFTRYYTDSIENPADLFVAAEECQILHFFWRGTASFYGNEWVNGRVRQMGFMPEDYHAKYVDNKIITTAVYDHGYLEADPANITWRLFGASDTIIDAYSVSSSKLKRIYMSREDIVLKPSALITDGVDLTRFKPRNLERFEKVQGRTICFGWVGNSKWGGNGDHKGLHGIIKPAIEKLQQEGYDIELVTSDRDNGMIPHYRMPDYYANIDCYICASLNEGTPNPVLEAMACGVPVISTDVGLIPELFGEKQREFILEERSMECLCAVLRKLLDRSEWFAELSRENLESIKPWDWKLKTEAFDMFWKTFIG